MQAGRSKRFVTCFREYTRDLLTCDEVNSSFASEKIYNSWSSVIIMIVCNYGTGCYISPKLVTYCLEFELQISREKREYLVIIRDILVNSALEHMLLPQSP